MKIIITVMITCMSVFFLVSKFDCMSYKDLLCDCEDTDDDDDDDDNSNDHDDDGAAGHLGDRPSWESASSCTGDAHTQGLQGVNHHHHHHQQYHHHECHGHHCHHQSESAIGAILESPNPT